MFYGDWLLFNRQCVPRHRGPALTTPLGPDGAIRRGRTRSGTRMRQTRS
ncbi:hypothetical protein QJS66_05550 [Kocuria rhizophila]|nr:hypothetical protein QJS66_05550 [Kocuria rhizophila]